MSGGRTGGPRSLPLSWRLVILGVVVLQFALLHGRVWEHMFDWNLSILASYATIPPLVLAALLLRRQFGLGPWFLDSLQIAFLKFAVTASLLLVLLTLAPDAVRPPATATAPIPRIATGAPPRTLRPPPPPQQTFRVHGTVLAPDGTPRPGALVFLGGIDDLDYGLAAGAQRMTNDGARVHPSLLVARLGEQVSMSSTNAQLHTMLLRSLHDSSRPPVSLPVLPSGAPTALPFDRGTLGLHTIECTVHAAREVAGHIALLSHPFFRRTGDDGGFDLAGVPRGAPASSIHAFAEGYGETRQLLAAPPGDAWALTLTLTQTQTLEAQPAR